MTRTKGNIIVENIKVGDVHYEFEYNFCTKSTVQTLPTLNEDGNWVWQSVTDNGKVINYLVNPKYPHYSVNLYDYVAYAGCKML
jgi:hypothetical protein